MKGFVIDLQKATAENKNFRQVLYTAKHSQLVVMNLKVGEEIGEEVHQLDQFIRCESGQGKSILDGVEHSIRDGYALMIPAGTKHNIINTSSTDLLKLYTVYAPPNHRGGVVHETKAQAERDEAEHFDGVTTEALP